MDKIFGPGNAWVTAAKQLVSNDPAGAACDLPAGPSEVLVIADNPIGESGYFPDSGKWKVNRSSSADRVVVRGEETGYFDGEE